MDVFEKQKAQALNGVDLSRKGSVDVPIQPLIEFINSESDYFTTSSCSGRIIVFDDVKPTDSTGDGDNDIYVKKKGCKWLFTSHDIVLHQEVVSSLDAVTGDAVFKFEPFVLHVQCKSLQRAQQMLGVAVASGFRNSGISIGNKGKILVAVRSTHTMEVPLTQNGNLLVTNEYIQFLVELANKKMKENFRRIDRFFETFKRSTEEENKTKTNNEKGNTKTKKQKDKTNCVTDTHIKQKEKETHDESHNENEDLVECFLFSEEAVT